MNILTTLQNDLRALLLTDPWFAEIPVLEERAGVTLNELQANLGPLNTRPGAPNAKRGLVLIVKSPRIETADGDPNTTSAPFQVRGAVDVIENRLINAGPVNGTGLPAEDAALRVLSALHGYRPGREAGGVYRAARDAVEPLKFEHRAWTGFRVSILAAGAAAAPLRAAQPRALTTGDPAAGPVEVTLTSPDPDAAIHYTTNGAWPDPEASDTHTYTSPLLLTPPATLRTIGHRPHQLPSHVLTLNLST